MFRILQKALPVVAALVVILGQAAPARAQGLGQLTGIITDASGAAIPGVKVTATEAGTGLARAVESSTVGIYTIPSLRPAVYNLTVDAGGFRSLTIPESL